MKLYELFGWIGVAFILIAYALNTFQVLDSADIKYVLLNIFGAVGIIWSSGVKKDFQPVALNVVWLVVAMIGLARTIYS
jgi:hypothetical protein